MSYLSHSALDGTAIANRVRADERGALVTFVGHVRNHHGGRGVVRLEYSAYEAMADAECERIVREGETRWPVSIALEHRLGALAVGEAAVIVAVGGGHRGEAFEACRWIIEEVKRSVPVWKREFFTDGTTAWVDPTAGA